MSDGKNWITEFLQRVEDAVSEADSIIPEPKEVVDYIESEMMTVGTKVKEFYSGFMRDVLKFPYGSKKAPGAKPSSSIHVGDGEDRSQVISRAGNTNSGPSSGEPAEMMTIGNKYKLFYSDFTKDILPSIPIGNMLPPNADNSPCETMEIGGGGLHGNSDIEISQPALHSDSSSIENVPIIAKENSQLNSEENPFEEKQMQHDQKLNVEFDMLLHVSDDARTFRFSELTSETTAAWTDDNAYAEGEEEAKDNYLIEEETEAFESADEMDFPDESFSDKELQKAVPKTVWLAGEESQENLADLNGDVDESDNVDRDTDESDNIDGDTDESDNVDRDADVSDNATSDDKLSDSEWEII